MKEYTITRCTSQPDWENVPTLDIDYLMETSPSSIRAQGQLCYDENALYVRLRAVEADIRAEHTGLLDEVCEDSCLEFFFCPMAGDSRYFNIEINPNGAMFLGFGSNADTLVRLITEDVICPTVTRTADGWEVTYAIPYAFVRRFFPDFAPTAGSSMRANCYKCGELTPLAHFLCWNPVPFQSCAFHNPDAFGVMHFE